MKFFEGLLIGVGVTVAVATALVHNSERACMDASGAPACELRYVPLETDDVATN